MTSTQALRGEVARQRFEEIVGALTRSAPSKAARNRSTVSFGDPKRFLLLTKQSFPQGLKEEEPLPELPPRLAVVVALQKEDGKWEESPELVEALGGLLPDCPEQVTSWRWITLLCLAFIRRHSEFFDQLQEVADKALDWVTDRALLAKAQRSLPPVLDYHVDPEAVRGGHWQASAEEMVRTQGYLALSGPPAWSSQDRFRSISSADEALTLSRAPSRGVWRKEKQAEEVPPNRLEQAKKEARLELNAELLSSSDRVQKKMLNTLIGLRKEEELIRQWQKDERVRIGFIDALLPAPSQPSSLFLCSCCSGRKSSST